MKFLNSLLITMRRQLQNLYPRIHFILLKKQTQKYLEKTIAEQIRFLDIPIKTNSYTYL